MANPSPWPGCPQAGGVCTIEAVEHLGLDLRRCFEPGVEDTQGDEAMIRLDEDPNRVADAGVADGVGEVVHASAQHEGMRTGWGGRWGAA